MMKKLSLMILLVSQMSMAQTFTVVGQGEHLSRFPGEAKSVALKGAHGDAFRKASASCNGFPGTSAQQIGDFDDHVEVGPDFPGYYYARAVARGSFDCVQE